MSERTIDIPECPVRVGDTIQITKTHWDTPRLNNQIATVKSAKLEMTLTHDYIPVQSRWIITAVTKIYNEQVEIYSGQFQKTGRIVHLDSEQKGQI